MENGWIKIHKKITKKGFYKNSYYVHLWVHLLFKANWDENEFMWNGKIEKLQPGQFITGRKILVSETGIPSTTVERILDLFEKEGQIGQLKTTKYRLITILNWKKYQVADNRRTTDGQQTDTIKNIKNIKINTLSQGDEVFIFKDQMSKMKTDPDKRMLIIAFYWYFKEWTFENRQQYSAALKRELRPAKDLLGFRINDISKAMEWCSKEYKVWTLETTFKRITDLVNGKRTTGE